MVHHLTIIDPRHGLAGQRLELVSVQSERGAPFVVIRLPDGRRRSIRRSATDLSDVSLEQRDASRSTPRISVRTLLTLMHHLNSMVTSRSQEVIRNEPAIESVPRNVPVSCEASDTEYDAPGPWLDLPEETRKQIAQGLAPLLVRMQLIRAPTKVDRHAESVK